MSDSVDIFITLIDSNLRWKRKKVGGSMNESNREGLRMDFLLIMHFKPIKTFYECVLNKIKWSAGYQHTKHADCEIYVY